MKKRLKLIVLIALLNNFLPIYSQEEPVGHGEKISEILDINSWHSPVKKVLKKHKLPLNKVVIYGKDSYLVFYTSIPWDPMTKPNAKSLKRLELEIFIANHSKSYAIHDDRNKMRIEMTVDEKDPDIVRENIVILEGGEQNF